MLMATNQTMISVRILVSKHPFCCYFYSINSKPPWLHFKVNNSIDTEVYVGHKEQITHTNVRSLFLAMCVFPGKFLL